MFGFFKRRLLKRMRVCVDLIQIALYTKLWQQLAATHDKEEAKLQAAAVANYLFGSEKAPMHGHIPDTVIDDLTDGLLRDEASDDLHYGIIMSLRVLAAIEADAKNANAVRRILGMLELVGEIVPLPEDATNPQMMASLAETLNGRYCPGNLG